MHASLVILLLLFVSTCHGKEQEAFPPSGILPTNKWQKKVETPLDVSCPDPTDIEPCECTISLGIYLDLNCSNVQDEEQLRKVFSAFFPTTKFSKFTMHKNHGVKVLENGMFGNVSFWLLDILNCDLESVETDALTPSFSRLITISIEMCKLEIFPFERLTEFTSLQNLGLPFNKFHTVPPIPSSSLQLVDLSWNLITHLTPDIFTLLPAAEVIYLNNNQLTDIPKGAFTGLPKLEYVALFNNSISYLQSLTFDLVSFTPFIPALDLDDNNIEYVEVDAFKGVAGPVTISMANNALARLPEEVWWPVLEKNITVVLAGNNLACGCDVAWLVRNPQLLTMASSARCSEGKLLTDLNPADFDICG